MKGLVDAVITMGQNAVIPKTRVTKGMRPTAYGGG
jgi:hypothetical protein